MAADSYLLMQFGRCRGRVGFALPERIIIAPKPQHVAMREDTQTIGLEVRDSKPKLRIRDGSGG